MNDRYFQKQHLSKPCSFCPNMAGHAPVLKMERHGLSVYFCHNCSAEYVYFQSGQLGSTSLYTTINGKMYRYTRSYSETAQIWYVEKPGIPGVSVNEGMVMLKSFKNNDPTPILNPSNINEKLRTWLVFL